MKKVELTKDLKNLYRATSKVKEVIAERGVFLCIDGRGELGGEIFQWASEMLYSFVYTTKFVLRKVAILDFKVPKLECLWFVADPKKIPISEREWRLLIRIPEEVTKTYIKKAQQTIQQKKGLSALAVRRISWREGRALQVMHVGPYEKIDSAYAKLQGRAGEMGYKVK